MLDGDLTIKSAVGGGDLTLDANVVVRETVQLSSGFDENAGDIVSMVGVIGS